MWPGVCSKRITASCRTSHRHWLDDLGAEQDRRRSTLRGCRNVECSAAAWTDYLGADRLKSGRRCADASRASPRRRRRQVACARRSPPPPPPADWVARQRLKVQAYRASSSPVRRSGRSSRRRVTCPVGSSWRRRPPPGHWTPGPLQARATSPKGPLMAAVPARLLRPLTGSPLPGTSASEAPVSATPGSERELHASRSAPTRRWHRRPIRRSVYRPPRLVAPRAPWCRSQRQSPPRRGLSAAPSNSRHRNGTRTQVSTACRVHRPSGRSPGRCFTREQPSQTTNAPLARAAGNSTLRSTGPCRRNSASSSSRWARIRSRASQCIAARGEARSPPWSIVRRMPSARKRRSSSAAPVRMTPNQSHPHRPGGPLRTPQMWNSQNIRNGRRRRPRRPVPGVPGVPDVPLPRVPEAGSAARHPSVPPGDNPAPAGHRWSSEAFPRRPRAGTGRPGRPSGILIAIDWNCGNKGSGSKSRSRSV